MAVSSWGFSGYITVLPKKREIKLSQIIVTETVTQTLNEWAKSAGISVKQLANDILSEACTYFLAGKIASLKEAIKDSE